MNDMSAPRLAPPIVRVERLFHGWRPEGCDRVALLLEGGGALETCQAGVYHYRDGGLVSNTPLQHLLDLEDRINTLVFQVDLCCSCARRAPAELLDIVWNYFTRSGSSRLSTASGLA